MKSKGDHVRYGALAALLIAIPCSHAQDGMQTTITAAAPTWSGTWTAEVKDHYFGRMVDAIFADETVLQQSLDVNRRLGDKTSFSIMLWNSKGFHNNFGGYADETDAGLGISRKVGRFVVSGSAWIFFLYPGAGTDVSVLDAKAARAFVFGNNTITPYLQVQRYGLTNHEVPFHGGVYPMAGADYERRIGERITLAVHYHEGYDLDGGFGQTQGAHIFYTDIAPAIRVTGSFSIIPVRAALGGGWNDPGRPIRATWSAGFAKTF